VEIRWEVLLIIVGGAIVTLSPRVFPLVILSKVKIPDWGMRWLQHIPVAILAALLAGELLPLGQNTDWQPLRLVAAVASFAAALLTRSLLFTVAVGVIAILLMKYVG
jgi:branched-subunit amino acid transport protein